LIGIIIEATALMLDRLSGTLRQHGYRITSQRKAVLETIARAGGYLAPSEVYEKVRRKHPSIGLATVYRTLDVLKSLGVICEILAAGDVRTYTLGAPEHHHHLICSGCGRVTDFITRGLEELQQRLELESGFAIEGHVLEFIGRCPDCRSGPVD